MGIKNFINTFLERLKNSPAVDNSQKTQIVKTIQNLCGLVEPTISIVYLANAITKNVSIYLTSDVHIILHRKEIEAIYKIKICVDMTEVMEYKEILAKGKDNDKGIDIPVSEKR